VKRGKLCSEQGQIGGRGSTARATGRSDGRGRAAQSSGRPLEPSGNRRPEMDDRRRDSGCGTELGLQAGSPPLCQVERPTSSPAGCSRGAGPGPASVLVGSEHVVGLAGGAHCGARLEVAQRQRKPAIGVQATHLVGGSTRDLHAAHTPEGAATDPWRRPRGGDGLELRDGLWEGHRGCLRPPKAGRLASNLPLRQGSKGTRLPGGGLPDRVAGVVPNGQERAWTLAEGPTAKGGTIESHPIKMGRGSRADAAPAGEAPAATTRF